MNITVKHFSANMDILHDYIPGIYLSDITGRNYHLFCAMAEDKNSQAIPVGVILYTFVPNSEPVLELKYFFVPKQFRGQEVGKTLLKETLKTAKKSNVHRIFADLPPGDNNPELEKLLSSQGFVREQTSFLLSYALEDIIESPLGQNLHKMNPLMEKLISPRNMDKVLLAEIIPLIRRKKNPGFDVHKINNNYTKFFVNKESVDGCISFEQTLPEVLELKTLYIKKTPSSKYAVPALLSGIMVEAKRHLGMDVTIIMKLEEKNLPEAVKTVCGPPLLESTQDRVFLRFR